VIIFFYPYRFGIQNGANRRIELLQRILRKNNVDCEIFHLDKLLKILTPFQKLMYRIGLCRFVFFLVILKLLKRQNVKIISEVIFAPTWSNNFFLQLHDLKAFEKKQSRGGLFRKYIYLLFIKLSSNIIVGANFVKKDVHKQCNFPLNKIHVIPNGISDSRLNLASSFKESERVYDFLYLSGFAKHKNHELLINALPSGSKTCLIGQELGELKVVKDLINERKDEIKVDIFLDVKNDSELFALISTSRYCVFTSSYEGFGIPILEYAALNKYILASNIPAFIEMSDYIDEFFEVDDINGLATSLEKLNRNNYKNNNKRSLSLYDSMYSEDNIFKELFKLINMKS
jgi:glycosyltransferase involved in cell wall biosynthesis